MTPAPGHGEEPGFLDGDETPFLEPAPDEEAWAAYLEFAVEHLGADGSTGLTNAQLAEAEQALGATLPFEVGLFLVMGVPDTDGWIDWRTDPAGSLAEWDAWVLDGITFDVRERGFWSPAFGPRPDSADQRVARVGDVFPTLPRLFPLHRRRAVPVSAAEGHTTNDGNPVLAVERTEVTVYAADLAAFLHRDFGVPLPMWPPDTERRFPFWSELG